MQELQLGDLWNWSYRAGDLDLDFVLQFSILVIDYIGLLGVLLVLITDFP
jgi:hypothetical protein